MRIEDNRKWCALESDSGTRLGRGSTQAASTETSRIVIKQCKFRKVKNKKKKKEAYLCHSRYWSVVPLSWTSHSLIGASLLPCIEREWRKWVRRKRSKPQLIFLFPLNELWLRPNSFHFLFLSLWCGRDTAKALIRSSNINNSSATLQWRWQHW